MQAARWFSRWFEASKKPRQAGRSALDEHAADALGRQSQADASRTHEETTTTSITASVRSRRQRLLQRRAELPKGGLLSTFVPSPPMATTPGGAARDPGAEATAPPVAPDATPEAKARLLRALLSGTDDVYGVFEQNGAALYISPAVERLLGWRPEEIIGARGIARCGRQLRELRHPIVCSVGV